MNWARRVWHSQQNCLFKIYIFAYSYILDYIFLSHTISARLFFFHFFVSLALSAVHCVRGMRQKSSLWNSCYSTFSSYVIRCFCFVLLQNRTCHIICFFMYTVQFPSYFLRVYKRVQKGYKRVKKKGIFLSVQFTLL